VIYVPPPKKREPESWVAIVLRTLVLAISAAAVLMPVALPQGTLGAVVGTVLASSLAAMLARSRVWLATVWIAASLTAVLALLLGNWLVEGGLGPSLLGPHGAMAAADTVRFGLLAVGIVLALRTTAGRYWIASVFELMLVAVALSSIVAAHRDGAINHPRFLTDWALERGIDPRRILFWGGAATMLALVLTMLHEKRGRGGRVLIHLLAIGLTALLALFVGWKVGPPTPPRGGGLGLQGKNDKPDPRKGGQGGKGGKGGKSNNDDLEFKNDYSSSSQQSPVGVVLLHDDYSPPLGYYYFRQTAFSQFNGHRLVARTRDDIDRDLVTEFPTEPTAVPDAPKVGVERMLVHTTVALLIDHVRPFGMESPIEFAPKESPDSTQFVRAYDVTSAALAVKYEDLLGRKNASLGTSASSVYTELPDDPRYKQLADHIVTSTLKPEYQHDPFAQALAISSWLGKMSTYSLHSKHADAEDPTADFLFGDRIGYCVHFSHAAAYLLRARGLPARIAAGYVADEGRKGSGSAIVLRQKDAHAWAELWLDDFGWIIVDVAPANVLDPPDTPPDPDLQRMLGEMARGDKHAGKLPPPKKDDLLPSAKQIGQVGGSLLLAALLILYSIKGWRRFVPSVAGARSIHRVAYRAALDRLAETGWRREEGETRERFAARVTVAPTFSQLTREHVGRAFGAKKLATPDEVRQMMRVAGGETRAHARWWRLLLGILNPLSWTLSR
jgi:transglutaminase-like putative cysteine protease